MLRRLEADAFPAVGRQPNSAVTAPLLLTMAKRIESRGAVDIAKRAPQTCGQILRYAVAHVDLQQAQQQRNTVRSPPPQFGQCCLSANPVHAGLPALDMRHARSLADRAAGMT